MSQAERTARITEGLQIIERTARTVMGSKPPRGVTLDDLISLGHEELVKAADKFDPRDGRPWLGFLSAWLKFRFRDFLRSARQRERRTAPLEIPTDDGNTLPRPDKRAKNPADHAADRESKALGNKALADAAAAMPPPDQAAVRATEDSSAVREAVSPADLGAMLKAMLEHGKAGNVGAAKLVLAVLMPPTGHPPPQPPINVIVKLPGDEDEE